MNSKEKLFLFLITHVTCILSQAQVTNPTKSTFALRFLREETTKTTTVYSPDQYSNLAKQYIRRKMKEKEGVTDTKLLTSTHVPITSHAPNNLIEEVHLRESTPHKEIELTDILLLKAEKSWKQKSTPTKETPLEEFKYNNLNHEQSHKHKHPKNTKRPHIQNVEQYSSKQQDESPPENKFIPDQAQMQNDLVAPQYDPPQDYPRYGQPQYKVLSGQIQHSQTQFDECYPQQESDHTDQYRPNQISNQNSHFQYRANASPSRHYDRKFDTILSQDNSQIKNSRDHANPEDKEKAQPNHLIFKREILQTKNSTTSMTKPLNALPNPQKPVQNITSENNKQVNNIDTKQKIEVETQHPVTQIKPYKFQIELNKTEVDSIKSKDVLHFVGIKSTQISAKTNNKREVLQNKHTTSSESKISQTQPQKQPSSLQPTSKKNISQNGKSLEAENSIKNKRISSSTYRPILSRFFGKMHRHTHPRNYSTPSPRKNRSSDTYMPRKQKEKQNQPIGKLNSLVKHNATERPLTKSIKYLGPKTVQFNKFNKQAIRQKQISTETTLVSVSNNTESNLRQKRYSEGSLDILNKRLTDVNVENLPFHKMYKDERSRKTKKYISQKDDKENIKTMEDDSNKVETSIVAAKKRIPKRRIHRRKEIADRLSSEAPILEKYVYASDRSKKTQEKIIGDNLFLFKNEPSDKKFDKNPISMVTSSRTSPLQYPESLLVDRILNSGKRAVAKQPIKKIDGTNQKSSGQSRPILDATSENFNKNNMLNDGALHLEELMFDTGRSALLSQKNKNKKRLTVFEMTDILSRSESAIDTSTQTDCEVEIDSNTEPAEDFRRNPFHHNTKLLRKLNRDPEEPLLRNLTKTTFDHCKRHVNSKTTARQPKSDNTLNLSPEKGSDESKTARKSKSKTEITTINNQQNDISTTKEPVSFIERNEKELSSYTSTNSGVTTEQTELETTAYNTHPASESHLFLNSIYLKTDQTTQNVASKKSSKDMTTEKLAETRKVTRKLTNPTKKIKRTKAKFTELITSEPTERTQTVAPNDGSRKIKRHETEKILEKRKLVFDNGRPKSLAGTNMNEKSLLRKKRLTVVDITTDMSSTFDNFTIGTFSVDTPTMYKSAQKIYVVDIDLRPGKAHRRNPFHAKNVETESKLERLHELNKNSEKSPVDSTSTTSDHDNRHTNISKTTSTQPTFAETLNFDLIKTENPITIPKSQQEKYKLKTTSNHKQYPSSEPYLFLRSAVTRRKRNTQNGIFKKFSKDITFQKAIETQTNTRTVTKPTKKSTTAEEKVTKSETTEEPTERTQTVAGPSEAVPSEAVPSDGFRKTKRHLNEKLQLENLVTVESKKIKSDLEALRSSTNVMTVKPRLFHHHGRQ